mmetsp:Transcript_31967/g.62536  ORF Transcript_31967/g.62536 Transcript_31967/m.62536 type:complete len:797 (+) Transcript_31967:3-2393(+)
MDAEKGDGDDAEKESGEDEKKEDAEAADSENDKDVEEKEEGEKEDTEKKEGEEKKDAEKKNEEADAEKKDGEEEEDAEKDEKVEVPPSVVAAEEAVAKDQWNVVSWKVILDHCKEAPLSWARDQYEKFLKVFPTSALHWREYIEKEMKAGNLEHVEKLFERCLLDVLEVQLWTTYIKYIQVVKKGQESELTEAFEFVLKHLGSDFNAGPLWYQYAEMVKNEEETNEYETQDKNQLLRKIYQRAVCVPTNLIEKLWKDYDIFEHSFENKQLAAKFTSGIQSRHLAAKQDARERQRRLAKLDAYMLSIPMSSSDGPRVIEETQARLWLQFIDYETKYRLPALPEQRRGSRDAAPVQIPPLPPCATEKGRVYLAYRQALLCLRYRPEIWRMGCLYLATKNDHKAAEDLFEKGMAALPTDMLMGLVYAEYRETRNQFSQARSIYEKLTISAPEKQRTLAWILLMRFARRCQGVDSARNIFLKARKAKNITWHLFVEAANMESRANEDPKVAARILTLGYKSFQDDAKFVDAYSKFLFEHSDPKNLRAVFARALDGRFSPEEARPIWDRYVKFERESSNDLDKIQEAESKRNIAFGIHPKPHPMPYNRGNSKFNRGEGVEDEPESHTAYDIVERYTVQDLCPVTRVYMRTLGVMSGRSANQMMGGKPAGTTDEYDFDGTRNGNTANSTRKRRSKAQVRVVVVKKKNPLPKSAKHPLVGPNIRKAIEDLLPPARTFDGPEIEISRLMDLLEFTKIKRLKEKLKLTEAKKKVMGGDGGGGEPKAKRQKVTPTATASGGPDEKK